MKPRLLDLFCGAGGAAMGYERAGFDVTGVDVQPQPRYAGSKFWHADALRVLRTMALEGAYPFAAIHASPPCQAYSPHVTSRSSKYAGHEGKNEPRLIPMVREFLDWIGLPYVIENVTGARFDMQPNLLLCGTMFGLPIPRHRLFETSVPVPQPWHPPCSGVAKRYAEKRGWDPRDMTVTGKGRHAGTKDRWIEIMGWPADVPVTQHGLREAIPPAYTEWIGSHLMATVLGRAA